MEKGDRVVHSLKPGNEVGLRGPITTLSLLPSQYDKIIMVRHVSSSPLKSHTLTHSQISTGTGIAPFLQLLSKLPTSTSPRLHMIHALPNPDRQDWPMTSSLLPNLQTKFGDRLVLDRIPPGPVTKQAIQRALGDPGRVLVLVCLPPSCVGNLQLRLLLTAFQPHATSLRASRSQSRARRSHRSPMRARLERIRRMEALNRSTHFIIPCISSDQ